MDTWIKKVVDEKKPSSQVPVITPTKLSQIFSDSLGDWGDKDDSIFEEVKAAREESLTDDSDMDVFSDNSTDPKSNIDVISPGKRKATTSSSFFSTKQMKPLRTSSTIASRNLSQSWNKVEKTNVGSNVLRSKRTACDSPATYQSTCMMNSPLTYASNRAQPQPSTPQYFTTTHKGDTQPETPQWGDDSFQDINCSQLEAEAIASSQMVEARKNMIDVFGSDDSDDALDNLDDDSDDALAQAIKMSQCETSREEMDRKQAIALSQ